MFKYSASDAQSMLRVIATQNKMTVRIHLLGRDLKTRISSIASNKWSDFRSIGYFPRIGQFKIVLV